VTVNSEAVGTELLDDLTWIASRAAAAVLAVHVGDLQRREKPDKSPVTAADEASEAVILEGLAKLAPEIPVISEEATGHHRPAALGRRFFLVDPLDGTREFLAGRDEFTVNIALLKNGAPVAGVVAAPARGLIWRGRVGRGAERLTLSAGAAPNACRCDPIRARDRPPARASSSAARISMTPPSLHRSHCAAGADRMRLLAEVLPDRRGHRRSLSAARADLGLGRGRGHAVLMAAGGEVVRPDGGPLRYGERPSNSVVHRLWRPGTPPSL
jgi:3'(2'), 5'-bisphosphate nucleotidase